MKIDSEASDTGGFRTEDVPLTAQPGPWVLEIREPGDTQVFRLERGREYVIGTATESEIRLFDRTVSKQHVRVGAHEYGVVIEDLGSKNGLYIGDARVERAILTLADTSCVIGQSRLCLRRALATGSGGFEAIPGLVGTSLAMRKLTAEIRRYARLQVPVLVQGESGSGKDVVARALHQLSGRKGAYVAINCSSLLETLADSELFGHVRGAFSGAVAPRVGAFVEANNGTLFLDEVAELTPSVQAKLLRVVEDLEVRPVGGNGATKVTTRVVLASFKSLEELVEHGKFRFDLLQRIAAVTLHVPPLRQRKGDIPSLVSALFARMKPDVGERCMTASALACLTSYDWPGNVRELRSVLYRAAVTTDLVQLDEACVRAVMPEPQYRKASGLSRQAAQELLRSCAGNVSHAARSARVPRSTFRSWLTRNDDSNHPACDGYSPAGEGPSSAQLKKEP